MAQNQTKHEIEAGEQGTSGGMMSVVVSTLTLALVAAIGVGLYRGWMPLEQKAVSIIGARAPTIAVRWPSLAATTATKDRAHEGGGPLGIQLLSVASTALTDVPTWLPRQMQEQIVGLANQQLNPGVSPLSGEPLERIGSVMERSGWFDGRPTVRREAGGRVVLSGEWRIPGAVVREAGRDHLISWDGKPMPVVYEAGQTKLKALVGVSVKPPMGIEKIEYTRSWPGEDVQAGLELLRLLQGKTWADQVVGVDVKNYEKDRTLSIVTTGGGRLNWGGRPNKPKLGEAATAAKIATIDWLQKRFNSIDAGGKTIDVYWQGRPLEIDVSATGGNAAAAGRSANPVPAGKYPTSPLPRD